LQVNELRLLRDYTKLMSKCSKLIFFLLVGLYTNSFAQSTGEVIFVGFNADGNDGFAFLTFVPLASGTQIHFSDNEWNGSAIGGGGAFIDFAEGAMTWQNNTGNTISSGTVIRINNTSTTPVASLGTITTGTIALANSTEVLYMFLGTNASTPTRFLSAIANGGFSVGNGQLTNTGLTAGTNAVSFTADQDVMVYNGSKICSSTIAACAANIANTANWITEDGGGDQSNNSIVPDFPGNVTTNFYGVVFEPVTYYSRNTTSGGIWDSPNSWTTNSDGSGGPLATGIWPASSDNVVILSGHTITVNAITDNQAAGVSPDGLGRTNVGPFVASNLNMFYQTGDIQIKGTLSVTGIEMMTEGYTKILSGGAFTLTSSYVNLGFLEADAGSTFNSADDLILAGFSNTIINTTSISNDDLIISFTDATLCGMGVTTLQNGSGSTLTYANGATVAQICTTFTVGCVPGSNPPCSGSFPVVGTTVVLLGNVGPGGVGNSTNNKLWLRADGLSQANNSVVSSWADVSGNALTATNSVAGGTQPTFLTNSVNTILPSISFDGGDWLTLGTPASLNLIPRTDNWSFFTAFNVATNNSGTIFSKAAALDPSERQYQYGIDNVVPNRFYGIMGGTTNKGAVTATGAWTVGTGLTAASATGFSSFVNETSDLSAAGVGTVTVPTIDVLIGARRVDASTTTSGFRLTGNIGEIALYNAIVNTAQRIIIDNYLSAKYATTLAANDLYTMDNAGNGNYDFEVAGIGRATDGTKHFDGKGSGMVRMWNPSDLGNSEFLIWGRDNSSAVSSTTAVGTAVDGTIIKERLTRIWRVSESGGDVGTVSISFDISGLGGSPFGSNLRLLIDRNGNGFADNDVTPVIGSFSSNIVVFSGINFQSGDRFTLGNTNLATPLPVEFLAFNATAQNQSVLLTWSTATEINNQDFTIERSPNKTDWVPIGVVKGAGNSTTKLDYQFVDEKAKQGVQYYRLRQTDFDGAIKYSDVVSIEMKKGNEITVYPNPSSNSFTIVSPFDIGDHQVRFINVLGSEVRVSISHKELETTIDPGEISSGMYFIQLITPEGLKSIRVVRK
jgi:Secretion system C-terminal sorting domain